ncbi:hypothetical protein C3L33_06219, partial [Rhododendron williamsianum]
MAKALVLLQLTLLLAAACFTVSGNEAEGVAFSAQSPSPFPHSPIYSPSESPKYPNSQPPYPHPHEIQPPSQPPVHPPTHSPVQYPPSYSIPKRSLLAVQGVVCFSETPMQQHKEATGPRGQHRQEWLLLHDGPKEHHHIWFPQVQGLPILLPNGHLQQAHRFHYGMQGAILMPQKLPQPPAQAPQLSPLSPRYDPAVLFPYELFQLGPLPLNPKPYAHIDLDLHWIRSYGYLCFVF